MDRYAVTEMVCAPCGLRQPVAGACAGCGAGMARYYCSICHLFDDEPGRSIYHCPFCNVCRRGQGLGVDFFHCMQCNACMSLSLFNQHTCRERAMEVRQAAGGPFGDGPAICSCAVDAGHVQIPRPSLPLNWGAMRLDLA
jgi:hypothetical protein